MAVISTTTKGRLGLKLAGRAARHPRALIAGGRVAGRAARPTARLGLAIGRPLARRRARRRARGLAHTAQDLAHTAQNVAHTAQNVAETAVAVGEALVTRGPRAAQALGLAQPPKQKRTAPRIMAGAALGASAVYFLEPGGPGAEHRRKALELVS